MRSIRGSKQVHRYQVDRYTGRQVCACLPVYLSTCVFIFLTACAPIQLTRPVTKIGLLAPFEGKQRAIGYEALYAVKLALRERNGAGGVAGWLIELVALDEGDPLDGALRQAPTFAADPDVTFVLGIVAPNERERVQAEYAQRGLALNLIDVTSNDLSLPDTLFVERYRALSGGITPGALALRTYTATQAVLAQIEQHIRAQGKPSR